jgi:mono/diheme cytochrome c family protein
MKCIVTMLLGAALLQGCATGTVLGYRFPLGDVARGREAFLSLECHGCHILKGPQLPPYPGTPAMTVSLGGHTPRIESYGDILTSVVNPSHRLARSYVKAGGQRGSESPMAAQRLNDVMTVQQLADLVAFLQTEYDYVPPPVAPYWESYPGGNDDRPRLDWPY